MQPEHRDVDHAANDDGDGVTRRDAGGRCARIAAALDGDAVIDRPGKEGTEQDQRAQVTVDQQMRQRPGLHTDQHGMAQHSLDLAGRSIRRHEGNE